MINIIIIILFQFLLFLLNDPSRNLTDATLSEGRVISKI